jgi:hypothetical protein
MTPATSIADNPSVERCRAAYTVVEHDLNRIVENYQYLGDDLMAAIEQPLRLAREHLRKLPKQKQPKATTTR